MQKIVNIILMFIVLAILAMFVYNFFGIRVREDFLFSRPDQCKTICARVGGGYGPYCNSPYLKQGPAAMCNCTYDKATGQCLGKLADDGRCPL